jgi:hypothetical protein
MRIRIEPVGERGVVQAPFHLFGTMKREGNWYIARCPPVDVRLLREERLLKRNKISLKQRSFSSLAASSAALWIKR